MNMQGSIQDYDGIVIEEGEAVDRQQLPPILPLSSALLNNWAEESLPRALHATLVAAYKPGLSQEELREAIWTNGPPWLRGPKFKATCEILAFLLFTGVMQINPMK